MKIRYITNARLPTERAHGIQIMAMCNAFAKTGNEVELVAPARRNGTKGDVFKYYGVPNTFKFRKIKVLDLTIFAPVLRAIPYKILVKSFAKNALADARKNPTDLYYIRDEETFILFACSGLPSVFEMHTVPKHLNRYKDAFSRAIAIVTISGGIRDELIETGVSEEKIIVSPDGVDLRRFAFKLAKEDARAQLNLPSALRFALYTGQLFPWKGVNTLVQAASGLPENMEVIIVGGGAGYMKELELMVKNKKSPVRFIGQVSHAQIPIWLAAADCVVIPNSGKERISSHHTSPLKLFEAMAMGKPIIASDLPSIREILDSTCAVLIKPDDPSALHNALIEMLNDPRSASKIGSTARERAARYDWDDRANSILSEIKRLDRTP